MSNDEHQPEDDVDTAPDINDPELDEFTEHIAPAGEVPTPEFYKVPIDSDNVTLLHRVFALALQQLIDRKPDIAYFEILAALQNYYIYVATNMLGSVKLEEFEPNRFEVLQMIGITSVCINEIKPTAAQLEAANLGPTTH